MKRVREISKKYSVPVPKLVERYFTGNMGFTSYIADKPITMQNIVELIEFVDYALVQRVTDIELPAESAKSNMAHDDKV